MAVSKWTESGITTGSTTGHRHGERLKNLYDDLNLAKICSSQKHCNLSPLPTSLLGKPLNPTPALFRFLFAKKSEGTPYLLHINLLPAYAERSCRFS